MDNIEKKVIEISLDKWIIEKKGIEISLSVI